MNVILSKDLSEVNINGEIFKITKKIFSNKTRGKLETKKHVIKYSGENISIISKGTELASASASAEAEGVVLSVAEAEAEGVVLAEAEAEDEAEAEAEAEDLVSQTKELIYSFELKKSYNINLYKLNEVFITEIHYNSNIIFSENIIKITKNGSDTNYNSKANILSISKIRNSRWNGIPIGLLYSKKL